MLPDATEIDLLRLAYCKIDVSSRGRLNGSKVHREDIPKVYVTVVLLAYLSFSR